MNIETINLLHKERVPSRVKSSNKLVSCIDINAISGSITMASPIDNTIDFYGQSPANGAILSINSIEGYGDLDFPLCVKSDFCRNLMWITDTGNNKIIKIAKNSSDVEFMSSIDDITKPYNLMVNPNNGGIIVKHYKNGYDTITYFDLLGNSIFTIQTPNLLPEYANTQQYIESMPVQNSMTVDHVRNKLWFLSERQLYSVDLNTHYCTHFAVDSLIAIKGEIGIDVDLESGNALLFASANNRSQSGTIIEVNGENNIIIWSGNIARSTSECSSHGSSIISNATTANLVFMKFRNPIMIGEWTRYGSQYENNNSIRKLVSGQSNTGSWTAWGSPEPYNVFSGGFFVADGYSNISEFWKYKKDVSVTNLYSGVVVTPSEVSGLYRLDSYTMGSVPNPKQNPFISDYGYVIEKGKYPLCNCDYDLNSPDYDSYYANFPFKGF